ncbi:MAG: hypothetical protein H8Z69_00420 [Nanohaloarchaea archaeon]|nr:hypothetical protein [Candidatus Nanohaloarchaea archaeon]
MSNDEVELGGGEEDDYEVVPVGPIRKLERRIDEMEAQKTQGGRNDELVRDVLDIMKSNQKIVNDMTESTHELKNSVEDLTHRMEEVVENMNSFMDLLNEASETDLEGEVINDVHNRVAEAVGNEMQGVADDIKQSNEQVITNLEELNKSIKRSYTSKNKGNMMGGNEQRSKSSGPDLNVNRNQGNQQGGQGRQKRGRGQQNQNSRQQNQRQNNQNSRGSGSNNDNIRKLRKKFDKMNDE